MGRSGRAERGGGTERATLSGTAWSAPDELDLRAWSEQGRALRAVAHAAGWWIGDWLRYGNQRFGERYAWAERITGYDARTLMDMVYVASRLELSRRRERLSSGQQRSHRRGGAAAGPAGRPRGEDELVCPDCGCRVHAHELD